MKPLRTMLFVPAHNLAMLNKARTLPADAVILDLEDSVPPSEKANAREIVRTQVPSLKSAGLVVYVRINGLGTSYAEADLNDSVCEGLAGILAPKIETVDDAIRIDEAITRLEKERSTHDISLALTIETTLGVVSAFEIAKAVKRTDALIFGALDYMSDLGVSPSQEVSQLLYVRSHIAIAARAARIYAIDSVYPNFRDLEGLVREATLARQMGYSGKAVIHPSQIPPVNEIFTPGEAELEYAKRVVEVYEEATKRGLGAVSLDNKMVDDAVYNRAIKTLQLAKNIERMESERKSNVEG